ncbi:flagellar basal-body MS-ring/collar protein FliF [Abyssisolibacter fermentans]|uniref:flagellar basal-body MS-ring/collar protein FliF n=1 Tax=Abyssisolibacter fermentans TaxID=1766203 RepID=UPI00082A86AA|nr:flagellar basal-body MS-ring/collar protein FliF [Abyssisolibacter fermentans]
MGDTVEKAKNQIVNLWKELDKKRKIRLGITCLIILFGITAFIIYITSTNYEVLYQNLSLKDTAEITKKLDELNINWKNGDDENTILVPKEQKNKVKLSLASEGLPKEGYSVLDAFNDTSWTMTEYEKKQRVLYGIKNELADTISDIDGIEEAKVFIDIPEETNFLSKDVQATASVYLKLSAAMPLQKDKVIAIKNLVASSFKSLSPELVSVVDDKGKPYDINTEGNGYDFSVNEQMNLKYSSEVMLNNSIKKFLENLFGLGNVDVRTNIKMNFDSENTSIVQFSPPIEGRNEGLIRSMQKIKEYTADGETGGPAGVESNVNDTVDYATVDNNNSKYEKASDIINYELNQINREIKKNPGEIESLSVAVIINEDAIGDGELTDERKSEIEELVYAATGIDTKKVIVNAGKFKNNNTSSIFDSEMEQKQKSDQIMLYGIIGASLFILLAAGGILVARKRRKDKKQQQILDDQFKESEIESIDFKEESGVKEQINGFVDKKPDAVAQLLRSWLSDE